MGKVQLTVVECNNPECPWAISLIYFNKMQAYAVLLELGWKPDYEEMDFKAWMCKGCSEE
jgi:hypothetical protein